MTLPTDPSAVPPGDYLLFVLKRGVPSVAKWVRVVVDSVRPPAYGDLTADLATSNTIYVFWTAPDGGGTCGRAVQYDLRYSTSPIVTDTDFFYALPVPTGEPKFPGEAESSSAAGLPSCTPHYFALKTKDAGNRWSLMSTTEGSTTCGGCCAMMAGGGGAEARGAGASAEGSTPSTSMESGSLSSEAASGFDFGFSIERASASEPAWRIRGLDLEEVRALGVETERALLVRFPGAAGTLTVPAPAGQVGLAATWPAGRQIIGLGSIEIDHIRESAAVRNGALPPQTLSVFRARHSRKGDQLQAVRDSGGAVDLGPGDTLDVAYAPDPSGSTSSTSPHFLVIDGGGARGSAFGARSETTRRTGRFVLHQNQPNPFSKRTVFRFELPHTQRVTLEVLDVQGRRLGSVVNRVYPAGHHSIEWPAGEGRGLQPGVYLYRIAAGAFRDWKKMLVLP